MIEDWAVKYRPRTLDEICGQRVNVELLKERLSSPYQAQIFYGSSGCGKTTTARALANDIGAEVIELDAASNSSVDDVRELLEYVSRKSLSSQYKIFIIDECHMMSRSAWNALLKAVEEPPKGVIFIFCTTEYKALPQTILGRAQLFKFYPLVEEELLELYARVSSAEGFELPPDLVLSIIARTKNQARDFLKLLQKVVDSKVFTIQELDKLTSTPPIAMAGAYLQGVLSGDAKLAVSALKKIKTPLLEWRDRLVTLVMEIEEDVFGISELRYPMVQAMKLRDLGSQYKPRAFGYILRHLLAIKKEEEAYSLLFALALEGLGD